MSFTAGTRLTASMLNALVPRYLRQASDQALATTTYTTHNTFAAISVAAGETWEVKVFVFHNSADVGNDIKVRWAVTGGVTLDTMRAISGPGLAGTGTPGAGTAVDVSGNFQGRATTDSVSGGSTTSASVYAFWSESFVVTATTAGTFGMEWAQQAAVTGSTTTKAGSYLVMLRIA
jgi:hypothetical protein